MAEHRPGHAAPAPTTSSTAADDRRGFIAKVAAVTIGGIVTLVPFAAGLAVFFAPLRKAQSAGKEVRVATLDKLPKDGEPMLFPVIADRKDAWHYYENEPIGSVYLRLVDGKPHALQSTCPHAGCPVGFDRAGKAYKCPCHRSFFDLDGAIRQDGDEPNPAPRPMDKLACEVRQIDGRQEVWVTFQNFYSGIHEQKAKP